MSSINYQGFNCVMMSFITMFLSFNDQMSFLGSINQTKYEVGDIVKCSQWKGDKTYWKGEVVKRIKTIYQVEITEVRVEGDRSRRADPAGLGQAAGGNGSGGRDPIGAYAGGHAPHFGHYLYSRGRRIPAAGA